jgi:3-hydroxyacyl-[acyl-carrier-protein] dehydratase
MDHKLDLVAPLNHPCYAGHFPGNPVVPGVLLLDLVVEAIARGAPRVVGSVKFQRVLSPGESFELFFTAGEQVSFRCVRAGTLVAEGLLKYDAA